MSNIPVKVTNMIVIVVILVSLACIMFGFTGCAIRLYPVKATDAQVEQIRRVAIESYKAGMCDVLEGLMLEDQELIPWDEGGLQNLKPAKPGEKRRM